MAGRYASLPEKRAIVDRRTLAHALGELEGGEQALRGEATKLLKEALAAGRVEIARRLEEWPWQGSETAAAYSYLTDQILRLAYDFIAHRLFPIANPTDAERVLMMAVGGYGRGEMALHSDVDLAFVTPWKATSWTEQVVESLL